MKLYVLFLILICLLVSADIWAVTALDAALFPPTGEPAFIPPPPAPIAPAPPASGPYFPTTTPYANPYTFPPAFPLNPAVPPPPAPTQTTSTPSPAPNPITVSTNPFSGTTTFSTAAATTTLSTTFSNPSCPVAPSQTSVINIDLSSYFEVPSSQSQFQLGINWGSTNGRQVEFVGGHVMEGGPATIHTIVNIPMVFEDNALALGTLSTQWNVSLGVVSLRVSAIPGQDKISYDLEVPLMRSIQTPLGTAGGCLQASGEVLRGHFEEPSWSVGCNVGPVAAGVTMTTEGCQSYYVMFKVEKFIEDFKQGNLQ